MRTVCTVFGTVIILLAGCAAPASDANEGGADAFTTGAATASEIELGHFVSADGQATLHLGKTGGAWAQVAVDLSVSRRQDTATTRGQLDLEGRNAKKGSVKGSDVQIALEQTRPGVIHVRGTFDHETIVLDEDFSARQDVFVGAWDGGHEVRVEISASNEEGLTTTIWQKGEQLSTGTHTWMTSTESEPFEIAPKCTGTIQIQKKQGVVAARVSANPLNPSCDRFGH